MLDIQQPVVFYVFFIMEACHTDTVLKRHVVWQVSITSDVFFSLYVKGQKITVSAGSR